MAKLIPVPTIIPAAGEPQKSSRSSIGRVNSDDDGYQRAKITSPSGRESGQTPEFDEYTAVLKGELQVETRIAVHKVFGRASDRYPGPTSGYATAPLGGSGEEIIRGFAKAMS
jgi:hypothetical protein